MIARTSSRAAAPSSTRATVGGSRRAEPRPPAPRGVPGRRRVRCGVSRRARGSLETHDSKIVLHGPVPLLHVPAAAAAVLPAVAAIRRASVPATTMDTEGPPKNCTRRGRGWAAATRGSLCSAATPAALKTDAGPCSCRTQGRVSRAECN